MGQDNSPKVRQLARQERKAARRASYPRILIVSEGSKTEPLYFGDIRATYRLHSANVHVQPSQLGTAPVQVVEYARQLFKEGDLHKSIRPLSFDQVFAVFDRDDHVSYVEALNLADSLDGKLKNDAKEYVSFTAVASVPCFELWLLLHYEDIQHPINRNEVMDHLRQHIPSYAKGAGDVFAATRDHLETATRRAKALAKKNNAYTEPEPYTALADLVTLLTTLRG